MRLLALLMITGGLLAQGSQEARVQRWKTDLEAFARTLETHHPAPFARLPKAEFEQRLKELETALPALEDFEIAARWASLLGALGEEHTDMDFDEELGVRHLPLSLAFFEDGAHIVATDRPYQALLGARLDRVAGLPLERLYAALKSFVPHSQVGWYRHIFQRNFDDWPLLIQAAGLLPAQGSWLLEGVRFDGQAFAVEVPILDDDGAEAIRWEREKVPREPRTAYAYRVLGPEKTLFIRLRRCEEDPKKPFRAFLRQALGAYRQMGLKRVVVDLRGNSGGSDDLVNTLVKTLQKRLGPNPTLTALIDGEVFSAGAVAAWRLKHDLGARLVGEACGAAANHVGVVEDFKLPSGREISFGTEIHLIDKEHPDDFASPILPDWEVKRRHEDWIRSRDPVLAEALGGDPPRIGLWYHSPRLGRCRPKVERAKK